MINESIAHISCSCGDKFQVLNEEATDWNEPMTAELYYAHLEVCPNQ